MSIKTSRNVYTTPDQLYSLAKFVAINSLPTDKLSPLLSTNTARVMQRVRIPEHSGPMAVLTNGWIGRLRYALLLNVAILLTSAVTAGLAVSYADASIKTPMTKQALIWKLPRPGRGRIIAYATLMPFFSILQSALILSLEFLTSVQPIYHLTISVIFLSGWLVQWSFWLHCEITSIGFDNAGEGEICWQVNLDHRKNSMVPSQSSEGAVNGRFACGTVVIALYLAYFVTSLVAVVRGRKAARYGIKLGSVGS
ncbi:MAG: hypothetical protein Q9174_002964 [Haloplaca sp. 1 TL-2023]